MDPGVFRSKVGAYVIKTSPKGWTVERKYAAFLEFREALVRMYPGYIVPPLSAKIEKKLEPAYLEKTRHFAELFLNELLKHPVLRSSTLLFVFLSVPSEKEFEAKRKAYAKLPTPHEPVECRTPTTTANVSYDLPLKQYCSSLNSGLSSLKECFQEYPRTTHIACVDSRALTECWSQTWRSCRGQCSGSGRCTRG